MTPLDPENQKTVAAVTRDCFLYRQDQPELMCSERALRTPEIHKPNDFYGQASVLKRYAGLPRRYALKAVLEHGPSLRDELWEQDCLAPLPLNLACSEERAVLFRTKTGKPTVSIGFGYLYAAKLVDEIRAQVGPRVGTLVFPCHSTPSIQCRFDHEDYAERLANLPSAMHPITICAYWKDFLTGCYQPYTQRGFRIVTAGHMYDADFMLRFHDLCRRFRFAVSNQIGTHLFQSVASGCEFMYLDSSEVRFELPAAESAQLDRGKNRLLAMKARSRQLFGPGNSASPSDRRRFVDDVLGARHFRKPAVLRQLLVRAELLDKFAASPARETTTSWRTTPFLRRQAVRSQRLCRSVTKRLPLGPWKKSA